MDRSVIFVSFDQASPAIFSNWSRPLLELLIESRAAYMWEPQSACLEFVEWCVEEIDASLQDFIFESLPGLPWAASKWNPLRWKEQFLEECTNWEPSPVIVDLDNIRIVCGDKVLWSESKRVSWQSRIQSTEHPFHEGWIGSDLGRNRPCNGTYDCYSLESLPPLMANDFSGLDWLEKLHSGSEQELANYEHFTTSAQSLLATESGLPAHFLQLLKHPECLQQFRSPTGCYFCLDQTAVQIPETDWKLIRFLADSQDCVHWSLMFSDLASHHFVVATRIYTGSTKSNVIGPKRYPLYIPDTTVPLAEDITICAKDFSQFLFRWWIENELWFAINNKTPLNDQLRQYLAHYENSSDGFVDQETP